MYSSINIFIYLNFQNFFQYHSSLFSLSTYNYCDTINIIRTNVLFKTIRNFLILYCRNTIFINKILNCSKNCILHVFCVDADVRFFIDNFAIIDCGRLHFINNYSFSIRLPVRDTILPDNFNYTLIRAATPSDPRRLKLVNISTLKRIW